jgi:hypothetical protein
MAATYLFTSQELETLISRSKAIAKISQEMMSTILHIAGDPNSPKAQALYRVLIEEREQYKMIQREYMDSSHQIVTEFKNAVNAEQAKRLREEQEKVESKAKEAEEKAAQSLLNSLKKH